MKRSIFAWSLIGFIASIGLASCAQGTVFTETEEAATGGEGGSGASGSGPSGSTSGPSGSGSGGTSTGAGGAGGSGSGSSSSSSSSSSSGNGASSSSSSGGGAVCGDGACNSGETCMICPADCGPCNTCGDAKCDAGLGETCMTCPFDCGPCPGGNCAHNKCDPGAPLDPACDPCVTFICAFDDVCCTITWDDICVSYVESFCGEMCP